MSAMKQNTMQKMVMALKEMKNGSELEDRVAAYAHGLYDGYLAGKMKAEQEAEAHGTNHAATH